MSLKRFIRAWWAHQRAHSCMQPPTFSHNLLVASSSPVSEKAMWDPSNPQLTGGWARVQWAQCQWEQLLWVYECHSLTLLSDGICHPFSLSSHFYPLSSVLFHSVSSGGDMNVLFRIEPTFIFHIVGRHTCVSHVIYFRWKWKLLLLCLKAPFVCAFQQIARRHFHGMSISLRSAGRPTPKPLEPLGVPRV